MPVSCRCNLSAQASPQNKRGSGTERAEMKVTAITPPASATESI